MITPTRRKSVFFFIALGTCVVALAVALNIGWIALNWRAGLMLFLGVIFFMVIITGVVLNTIFLVREIRRNEQHDAFINSVTHELKTPVASIRLYLETLKSRPIDETKRREFYDIMLADSDRLLHTIEQVLRAGAKRKKIARTPVDFRETVRECVALARTRHHLSDDVLRYTESLPEQSKAIVLGDADELRSAVSNLIDNAIKYSGTQIDVLVDVTTVDERRIAVRVSDRGIGIPRTQLNQLFKRFYRIPGVVGGRIKGTGLGLFIVRSVAEHHGGRAYAESEGAGRGSTFTLQLPVAHAR